MAFDPRAIAVNWARSDEKRKRQVRADHWPEHQPEAQGRQEGSAKEPYPWSKGPDRLRDRQHCRGQGEPGSAIGHFDRWERWPGDSRLTRDVGKPDG